jgi:hypothetical protein
MQKNADAKIMTMFLVELTIGILQYGTGGCIL